MINLYDNHEQPRAVLVGLNTNQAADRYAASMRELAELARSLDLEVVDQVVQNAPSETRKTHIGSGKVLELKAELEMLDVDIVLFNESLSPMQMKNLEDILDTEVLDRTGVILQIFSRRARTREARLQVRSAQLQYMLPRLAGMRRNLSRQGGGSGRLSNKGAGEEKIELDRRHIEHQIAEINAQLREIEKERSVQRSARMRSNLPLVALVGYTNAGKSTLMNRLLRESTPASLSAAQNDAKQVFEADMLFATLDTSVRRIQVPEHAPFLLTDTVGFISDLPHSLVQAFRSTLSEITHADLLLEVIDGSDPESDRQHTVTTETLSEIGAGGIPLLRVFNKSDLCPDISWPSVHEDRIYLSARTGEGIGELLTVIEDTLPGTAAQEQYLLPYTEGSLLHEVQEFHPGIPLDYRPDGVCFTLRPNRRLQARLAPYLIENL